MSKPNLETDFHVGDKVNVNFGRRKLQGVITEDRGAIGVRGRHLFQVQIPMDPFEPMTVELPAEEMEAAIQNGDAPALRDKNRVKEYLIAGGLIAMLRANLGDRNQPRVWLCLDQLGNITHTFVAERGVIGGQFVPFGSLRDDKIFTSKRDEVMEFIESLGLSRQDAEKVITEIGLVP